MSSAQNKTETPEAVASERKSLLLRLTATPARLLSVLWHHPLLLVVLFSGSAIILATGSSLVYYAITRGYFSDRETTIEAALEQLDAGEYEQAKVLAERLHKIAGRDYAQLGYCLFIQGAVLAHEAGELSTDEERQTLFLVAARYLDEARDRGIPPGREQECRYLLATSLFHSGNYAESLRPLLDAIQDAPDGDYELYRLLGTAYLRDTQPDLNNALTYNRLWLENPSSTDAERNAAYLQQSEILLAMHDVALCQTALAQIDEDSSLHSEALIVRALLFMEEGELLARDRGSASSDADASSDKYRQAIEALERAQSKDLLGTSTRKSRYLLGICHRELGDVRAAREAFERARRMHYRTPEALAATVAEAEIAQAQGEGGVALTLWLETLQEMEHPSCYRNPWLSLSELRGRLMAAHKLFRDNLDFPAAMSMADAFSNAFPPDEIAQTKAHTQRAWAEHLLASASSTEATGDVTRAEARRRFRLAAEQYRQLARLRFTTREFPNDLWESGHCFLRGQNYELAIELLREFLANVPKKQHPHGLAGLGEAHLALGNYHEAIQALDDCIRSFPQHPETYRARILASQAYQELGKLAEARALLVENLDNSLLEPMSIPWKQSQFELGTVLFREATIREMEGRMKRAESKEPSKDQESLQILLAAHDLFQQAIDVMGQATERHQRDPESLQALFAKDAIEAQYRIGEAYRHSASILDESLKVEPTQSRRNALTQQMNDYLRESAATHHQLQDQLVARQNQRTLSPVEQSLLRNTYFAYADALFDMQAYDEAIKAYSAATNRYQHEPESLEALLQIASCYRCLSAPAEARGTLLQAQAVLSRIRPDADFTKTTRYTKKQWEQVLTWLSQI